MTVKELVRMSPDDLEKMSDEELRKWCEPYLKLTLVAKPDDDEEDKPTECASTSVDLEGVSDKPQRKRAPRKANNDFLEEAMKLAKLHGVNITLPKGLTK